MDVDTLRREIEPLFASVTPPGVGDAAPTGQLYITYKMAAATPEEVWADVRALFFGLAGGSRKSPAHLYWRAYPTVAFESDVSMWTAEMRCLVS